MAEWIKSPQAKYGGSLIGAAGPANRDATATATVAPSVVPTMAGILSPKDPMFWFAAIAAGGVALMAYSTYVPVVG